MDKKKMSYCFFCPHGEDKQRQSEMYRVDLFGPLDERDKYQYTHKNIWVCSWCWNNERLVKNYHLTNISPPTK